MEAIFNEDEFYQDDGGPTEFSTIAIIYSIQGRVRNMAPIMTSLPRL